MNPVTPTRVIGGRYVVLGELGRGGMGVVWRAEDRVMGRQVAVKELHLPGGLGPDERRRFHDRLLREARNAGRLNDPSIVTVRDVVTDGGVDHIVMELIEAPTLAEVVSRSGPLDERAAAAVALRLLSALRTAHEHGVIHRDVKPGNVMLARDGGVTLTDFGIAQAADDPRLTTTGTLLGSPGYLAPEQLDGSAAGPASDLWSLGATLFYAVQGVGPFSRETTAGTIGAVLNAEVPTTRTRGPLGAVIAGLLQRSPEARLTGVQAAALLSGEPPTPPTGEIAPTTRPVGSTTRWRWPALLGVLALGLAAGVGAGLLWPRGTAGPAVLTYGGGGDLPVFDISSPSCLQGRLEAGRQFPYAATVSCDEPHDLGLFASFDTIDTSRVLPYPGRTALGSYAGPACQLVFGTGIVTGTDKDALRVTALVPSEAAFAKRSSPTSSFTERDALCLLGRADGAQLTGTRVAKDGT